MAPYDLVASPAGARRAAADVAPGPAGDEGSVGDLAEGGATARSPLRASPRTVPLTLGAFAAWTALGLVIVANRYVAGRWAGERPLTWSATTSTMVSMWVWAALTPPIVRLAELVPVGPGRRARSLAAHAGLAVGVAGASAWAQRAILAALDRPVRASLLAAWLAELVIDALCYAGLVALAHAWRYHALYRDRQARAAELEAEVLRARLQALELQLRPHVLFNTLHAVSALVRTGRGDDAVRVVAGLGDLLRALLRDDGAPKVALRDELALLERYVRIERIRFGDRLDVRVAVAPGLDGALVPRWLLQPLVENAVRHGPGGAGGPGLVEVAAARRGDVLELRVRNGGEGAARAARGAGVGLANTRERLRCLYGPRFELTLRPLEGGGAEVLIALPFEPSTGPCARPPPSPPGLPGTAAADPSPAFESAARPAPTAPGDAAVVGRAEPG
jgi:hypothetical protein